MSKFKARVRRLSAKALLMIIGLLFGCLVAEAALRIIGYSYPIFYQTDTVRGYAAIPNVEGWYWVENKNYVRINSAGFRDNERSLAKPADTIRVAVIGDSFAEARNVSVDNAFWSVIEKQLEGSTALAGKKIEVLNFGVGGYGTVEELLTLRQRVWDYSPDVVLLAVCVYNDITDNYEPFKRAAELPYFKLEGDRLVYDNGFLQAPKYLWHDSSLFKAWVAVHNHSRLVQLLHHAQFGLRTRLQAWKEEKRLARAQKNLENTKATQSFPSAGVLAEVVGIQNMIYREPDDQYWNEAWRLTDALITQMGEEVAQHGARFMVATITSDIQVYPDPAVRQALMKQVGVDDLFYPNRRLRSISERHGIAFLDLAEPMEASADRDKIFFHGFGKEIGNGHWNEAGHRVAGELMAKRIEELLAK
jgi:GDSL-like Lipase/Acylhydrolase family